MNRKLATIRTISAINPHFNADNLELATVDGWTCVVKKGEFKANAVIVYLEVDSFVPTAVAPFLTKPGHKPRTFEGVEGERLRTIRLRGELSQGLILPLSVLPQNFADAVDFYATWPIDAVGMDVTEILNINKWERPLPPQLVGMARGNFPSWIPRTDQERIQNLFHKLTQEQIEDTYEITLKLDGSSATYFVNQGETGVCSRNLNLRTDGGNAENSFVKKFYELNLAAKLTDFNLRTGRNIALQGELFGLGINGNHEGISDHRYNIFDIFDIDKQGYVGAEERADIVSGMQLQGVPVIGTMTLEGFKTIGDFLAFAERGSIYNKVAEGVVFKSLSNPDFSFKCINTHFLLNGGE